MVNGGRIHLKSKLSVVIMDIESLKMFAVLAEQLNFTEAASTLETSQPTLSRKIRNLEKKLNVTLVHRIGNKISLTPHGENFLESTLDILSLVEYSVEKLQVQKQGINGRLRIGSLSSMSRFLVQNFLPTFHQKFPNIDIHWRTLSVDNLKVMDNIDLVISPIEPNDDRIVCRKLSQFQRACYASPKYLNEASMPTSVDELKQHQCITQVNRVGVERYWKLENSDGERREVSVEGQMTTDSIDIATSMALEGLGIALLPITHAREYVLSGQLIPLFHNLWFEVNHLYAFYKPSLHTPNRFKLFINELEEFRKQWQNGLSYT